MVERFDLVQYEHFDQLDRAVNGDWVRYSDHEAELSALKKQVEELTAERGALEAKVIGLIWMLPDDVLCGDVQSLHKRALSLRCAEAEAAALREAEKELACQADFIHRIQAALAFWMPGVHESIEIELNGRPGDDAMLLAGFEGEVPAESWGDRTLTRAAAAEAVAAELRKERDRLNGCLNLANERTDENFDQAVKSAFIAAKLRRENEALRKALAFYADTSKYPAPLTGGMGDLWADCGQIARAALTSTKETGE